MDRKLVTVRTVAAVHPVKGADRIETIVLDGWSCVVQIGKFKVGDQAVFFEIDSFLPASDARWAFLEEKFTAWNGQKGFRVKSTKIRGVISQGIVQPLDTFPEIFAVLVDLEVRHGKEEAARLLRDMSFEEMVYVRKYEVLEKTPRVGSAAPPTPMPAFIRRTDQERCQNLPHVFEDWKDETFQETTKMDGSSMTVYFVRRDSPLIDQLPSADTAQEQTSLSSSGRFGVCSRNIELPEDKGGYFWDVARKNELPEKLSRMGRNIAIQGELCGSTIQSNFEGFPKGFHDLFVFSVWDMDTQRHIKPRETEEMASQLGLKHVPVEGYHRLGDIATSVQEILLRAEGKGLNGKKREGIVLKHVDGEFSFKAISNSYLLKHGE
ncbi:RNA ligase, DRB0094 family [Biscogniauxia marginata]|nr:RNA ligase, DRB0094 family [Biscogniauxia marginata]